MSIRDPNQELPAEFARAAELHIRQRMGETLAEGERAELDAASVDASTAEFLNGLDDTDETLAKAMKKAQPSANFAKKVMAALPVQGGVANTVPLLVATSRPSAGRWRILVGVGIAAAVALAVIGTLSWWKTGPSDSQNSVKAPLTDAAAPKVVKGNLKDASGRTVQSIEAGQRYRTGDQDVVLQVGEQSRMRITPNTEFEALAADAAKPKHGFHLRNGAVYAKESGPEPLLVRATGFDTEVDRGVAWVMHEAPAESNEQAAPAQGIVLVFQGSARVHLPEAGETLTVGEGELYFAGGNVEPMRVFLDEAPRRAAALEVQTPETQRERHARYRKVVEGYRSDLRALDEEIARTSDAARLAEMKTRRSRVHDLLEQHRRRLDGMSSAEEDAPAKARSLRRTIEKVRKGQDGFSDPNTWM